MPIYSGNINITGSITPSADDTYDAGTPEAAFQDIYVSSGSLWIGDTHKVSIDTDGKLKFRKRKTDAVPAVILAAGGSSGAALAFAGKGSLSKMKLKHWKLYARSLGGGLANAKVKDIFRIDQTADYQAESEVAQEDIYANFKALQGGGALQGISTADSPTFTALTTTGKITAQEFHTSFVSSSIIFKSGSTIFGDSADDTHQFTGTIVGQLFDSTIGPDLVSNGGFSSNTTGWAVSGGTIASVGSGQSGNCLQITTTSETNNAYAYQNITTVVGKLYRMTAYVKSGTSGNREIKFGSSTDSKYIKKQGGYSHSSTSSWIQYSLSFKASATTTQIRLYKAHDQDGTLLYDTVAINEYNALVFNSDYDTAIGMASGSNSISMTTGGIEGFKLDAAQTSMFLGDAHVNPPSGHALLKIEGASSTHQFLEFWNQSTMKWRLKHDDDTGNLHFSTSYYSGDVMVLDRDGYVGIGTGDPGAKLEVFAKTDGGDPPLYLRRTNNADGGGIKLKTGTTDDWIIGTRNDSTSDFRIYSYGASADVFNILRASGNVGIGETSPSAPLHLTTAGSTDVNIVLEGPNSTWSIGNDYSNNGYLKFSNNAAVGTSTAMTFGASGKVGIGTTGPDSHLHISSSVASATPSLHIEGSGSSVVAVDGTLGRLFSVTDEMSGSIFRANTIAGVPAIDVKSNYNVLLDPYGNGKVGIGTTAPSASLQVGAGASLIHGELLISADDGLHNYLRFTNGGAGESHYPSGIWYAPSGRMELRVANTATTSNAAQLVLAANGNVGIGDTTPDYLLDVAGTLGVDGAATFASTVAWSGGGSANANTAYSWGDHGLSAQDKTDIGNLSNTNSGDQTLPTRTSLGIDSDDAVTFGNLITPDITVGHSSALSGTLWSQGNVSYFTNTGTGQANHRIGTCAILLGPSSSNRTGGHNSAGIGFDHLLNHQSTGNVDYHTVGNTEPMGWIGLHLNSLNGYENSHLDFATRGGTDEGDPCSTRMRIKATGEVQIYNATQFFSTVLWSGGGSANANTAYGWGDHGLSSQDKTDIGNLSGTNTGDTSITDGISTTSSSTRASATAVKAAYDRGSTGVTNAASAQSTANTGVSNAASAQSTANAALPKAGGTMTGQLDIHNDYALLFRTHGSQASSRSWKFYNDVSALGDFQLRMSTSDSNTIATSNATIHTTWNKLGNMGVGTVSPTARLHVYGSVTDNQSVFKVSGTSGSLFEINDSLEGNLMEYRDRSGNHVLTATAAGRVGIGTLTPSSKFHVQGTISGSGDMYLGPKTTCTQTPAGGWTVNDNGTDIVAGQGLVINQQNNNLDAIELHHPGGANNTYSGIRFVGSNWQYARIIGGSETYSPDSGFLAFHTAGGGGGGNNTAVALYLAANKNATFSGDVTLAAGKDLAPATDNSGTLGRDGAMWDIVWTNEIYTTSNSTLYVGGAAPKDFGTGALTWNGGGSANANTAYTYSQVGHLPLAGGSVSDDITMTNSKALRWTSDDVRIEGTTASDNIKFYCGGSERFKIAQTGGATFADNITVSGQVAATLTMASGIHIKWADDKVHLGGGSGDGAQSVAVGYAPNASGAQAVSVGYNSNATGAQAIAFGYNSTASGAQSQAYGYNVTTSGASSVIFGYSQSNSAANVFYIDNMSILCEGDVTSNYSDIRLKENIRPIENALTKLETLRGVSFDYKEENKEIGYKPFRKSDIGLIAQEVEKVLPDAVDIAPFDVGEKESLLDKAKSKSGENYLTVRYERLVPLLIQAVKELNAEVKELKEKINENV